MGRKPKYALVFAPETVAHMDAIDAKHHCTIERTTDEQLRHTPERATRNRKPLEDTGPFGATWELRFGPQNQFRVFYEVNADAHEVHVLAIGVKERDRLFIGGKEYRA
jgi:mRNA-degrading endonuclease RelE of RelBE toxin-antitoxin system